MSIPFNLKQIFGDFDRAVVPVKRPVPLAERVDELLITGLPETFQPQPFFSTFSYAISERGILMPSMAWQSALDIHDRAAVLMIFEEPLPQTATLETALDCLDDAMKSLHEDPSIFAIVLEPSYCQNYEEAVRYLQRHSPRGPERGMQP